MSLSLINYLELTARDDVRIINFVPHCFQNLDFRGVGTKDEKKGCTRLDFFRYSSISADSSNAEIAAYLHT